MSGKSEVKSKATARIEIRLTNEEKNKAQEQAKKMGTDISGYIRLMINLDASEVMIQGFKTEGTKILKKMGECNPQKAQDLGMAIAIHKVAFAKNKELK